MAVVEAVVAIGKLDLHRRNDRDGGLRIKEFLQILFANFARALEIQKITCFRHLLVRTWSCGKKQCN